MTTSPQFITFRSGSHKMAIDIGMVRHLSFANKVETLVHQQDFSIGAYQSGETQIHAVEFEPDLEPGQRLPLIITGAPGNALAIAVTEIFDLASPTAIQQLPRYDKDRLNGCFPSGFSRSGATYYIPDLFALKQLAPDLQVANQKPSDVAEKPAQKHIPTRQQHWLSYQMSIARQEKSTGQIELHTDHECAYLGWTVGHLTYANYGSDFGETALHLIAKKRDWKEALWHEREIEADHNINKVFSEIITELKHTYAQ